MKDKTDEVDGGTKDRMWDMFIFGLVFGGFFIMVVLSSADYVLNGEWNMYTTFQVSLFFFTIWSLCVYVLSRDLLLKNPKIHTNIDKY